MTGGASVRRKAGRPTGASSAATRQKIMDAAVHLFSAWGYDATRVKDVALRAEVDGALVHRYFGDKEDLYHAVVVDAVKPVRVLGQRLLLRGLPVDLLLSAWVEIISTYFERRPDVLMLVTREAMGGGKRIRKVLVETLGPLYQQTVGAVEAGLKRSGHSRVDAQHLVVNTLGMIAIWHTHAPLIEAVVGMPVTPEKARLAQRDQIMEMVLHGAMRK